MNIEKYIGLDVHQATISVAVMDSTGKVIMESILETKASTIVEFFAGLRGALSVTLEEGTGAAWRWQRLWRVRKPQPFPLRLVQTVKNYIGTRTPWKPRIEKSQYYRKERRGLGTAIR